MYMYKHYQAHTCEHTVVCTSLSMSHWHPLMYTHWCMYSTVNEKVATMDTVIGHNELVCHTVHRHEPPVSAQPITIIHNDDHLVVLDKPASIPVNQVSVSS